jgi:hypothetical protein
MSIHQVARPLRTVACKECLRCCEELLSDCYEGVRFRYTHAVSNLVGESIDRTEQKRRWVSCQFDGADWLTEEQVGGLAHPLMDAPIWPSVAQVILAATLVAVTTYYAIQTRATVTEMRRARGIQVMPKLVARLELLGGGGGLLRVENVGPGPGLDIDIELILEPDGPTRNWKTPVMASGEGHSFQPVPGTQNPSSWIQLDKLVENYTVFRIRGTSKDSLGQVYPIDDAFDIQEFWNLTVAAERIRPHEYGREAVKTLEKMEKHLGVLAKAAKKPETERVVPSLFEKDDEKDSDE